MANQNNNKGGQQQDVNQLLKVRREKLQNLQEAGKDPFQITKYNVTHHSSDRGFFFAAGFPLPRVMETRGSSYFSSEYTVYFPVN